MNMKAILSTTLLNKGFISGVLVSCFIFLLISLTPGIGGERHKEWAKKGNYHPDDSSSNYPQGEEKNLRLVVKYVSGGEIVVTDEKGEVIARSQDNPIKEGPLTELRNIKFVTVTENVHGPEEKDQSTSLLDSIISPAMAATTVYEYHYVVVDNQVVACRKHRRSPAPHKPMGNC